MKQKQIFEISDSAALQISKASEMAESKDWPLRIAVDVKDGMEEQYLALEAFFGPIHDLAIEKGMLNSQAVFKVVNTTDDGENLSLIHI